MRLPTYERCVVQRRILLLFVVLRDIPISSSVSVR